MMNMMLTVAIVIVLVMVLVLFLLWSLMLKKRRKNTNNHDITDQQGLQSNAMLSAIIVGTVVLIIPLLYFTVQYQQADNEAPLADMQTTQPDNSLQVSKEQEKILAAVGEDVKKNPQDVEGRIALAQVYTELERHSDAAVIYSELSRLTPEQPDILVNYAEALARSHGNRLSGKPTELLNEALRIEPKHGRALWLAGFTEKQANNTEAAVVHWQHLLTGLEPDSEMYQQVEKSIKEVEAAGSEPRTSDVAQTDNAKQTIGQSITVNVSLAAELQSRVDPGTMLFIFARASDGPPMPLAVYRALAQDLPFTVTLDDSMAMMPQMSLSRFNKVIVAARLSSNGQAQGQAGDYEGFSDVVEMSVKPVVDVVINSIKP